MTASILLAFDPGKQGAVAARLATGRIEAAPLPYRGSADVFDANALLQRLDLWGVNAFAAAPVVCAVEYANSFGMGRQSAFVYGQGIGALITLADLQGWSLRRPRPVEWQKVLGVPGKSKDDPLPALDTVARRFPSVPLILPGCRKPHAGMVDALGILAWLQQQGF